MRENTNIISENEFQSSCGCDFLVDDKTAEEFTKYMKNFKDLYRDLSQIVKKHTTTARPFLLDLGCGPGLLSNEILKQIPDAIVIGIDPVIKMLSLATKNIDETKNGLFIPLQGVSERIPLKNDCIDTIVSRFSLPYWKNPPVSFFEMHRILKPGGRVVLEALNKEFPKWKLFGIKIGMLLNHSGRDVCSYHVDAYKSAFTHEEVQMFFQNSGFTIIEQEGTKKEWKFLMIAGKRSNGKRLTFDSDNTPKSFTQNINSL
jgi:ubiquinone/menaquinone biosynthesis C-methylase UbiE